MTIYDIRKILHVHTYSSNGEGAIVYYQYGFERRSLHLKPHELVSELIAIGSESEGFTAEWLYGYAISQWDALNMAIRFELKLQTENEINNSDIGKAINNFLK